MLEAASAASPLSPSDAQRAPIPATIKNELLLRRLFSFGPLSPGEIELVLSLGDRAKTHEPGSMICPKSDGSPHPRAIISGWACRPRILSDGRRQMLAILLPGDILGDRGQRSPLAMSPAVALTVVRTVSLTSLFDALADSGDRFQALGSAVAQINRQEEAQLLDHVVRLGCQTAVQRVANCLLELHRRLSAIGFTHRGTFPMPLTQDTLADLLGLSLVHINRVIRQLKRDGLVEIQSGTARVKDFARLALLADFPDQFDKSGNVTADPPKLTL